MIKSQPQPGFRNPSTIGMTTQGQPMAQPTQYGGKTGFDLANDPQYITDQIQQGYQRTYGRAATEEELNHIRGYVTKPDTFSDNQVRQGWNPYWESRFFDPSTFASGSSGVAAGNDTIVQGAQPQLGGGGGGFSSNAQNGVASFNAPGLLAPYTQEFRPTDINSILSAPAFQAAQANGIDEIQRGAAARGTLLTGGTLKDLQKYSMGLSLGELNNQFNRDATTFGTNRDTFYGNQNNAYNKLSGFTNTGAGIASNLGGYGSGYSNNAQVNANNQGNLITGQGDASASAGLANAQNTNQTLGGIAESVFQGGTGADGKFSWGNIFKKKPVQTSMHGSGDMLGI